jgi:hypothetical protein
MLNKILQEKENYENNIAQGQPINVYEKYKGDLYFGSKKLKAEKRTNYINSVERLYTAFKTNNIISKIDDLANLAVYYRPEMIRDHQNSAKFHTKFKPLEFVLLEKLGFIQNRQPSLKNFHTLSQLNNSLSAIPENIKVNIHSPGNPKVDNHLLQEVGILNEQQRNSLIAAKEMQPSKNSDSQLANKVELEQEINRVEEELVSNSKEVVYGDIQQLKIALEEKLVQMSQKQYPDVNQILKNVLLANISSKLTKVIDESTLANFRQDILKSADSYSGLFQSELLNLLPAKLKLYSGAKRSKDITSTRTSEERIEKQAIPLKIPNESELLKVTSKLLNSTAALLKKESKNENLSEGDLNLKVTQSLNETIVTYKNEEMSALDVLYSFIRRGSINLFTLKSGEVSTDTPAQINLRNNLLNMVSKLKNIASYHSQNTVENILLESKPKINSRDGKSLLTFLDINQIIDQSQVNLSRNTLKKIKQLPNFSKFKNTLIKEPRALKLLSILNIEDYKDLNRLENIRKYPYLASSLSINNADGSYKRSKVIDSLLCLKKIILDDSQIDRRKLINTKFNSRDSLLQGYLKPDFVKILKIVKIENLADLKNLTPKLENFLEKVFEYKNIPSQLNDLKDILRITNTLDPLSGLDTLQKIDLSQLNNQNQSYKKIKPTSEKEDQQQFENYSKIIDDKLIEYLEQNKQFSEEVLSLNTEKHFDELLSVDGKDYIKRYNDTLLKKFLELPADFSTEDVAQSGNLFKSFYTNRRYVKDENALGISQVETLFKSNRGDYIRNALNKVFNT